jgi:hypothetical protein
LIERRTTLIWKDHIDLMVLGETRKTREFSRKRRDHQRSTGTKEWSRVVIETNRAPLHNCWRTSTLANLLFPESKTLPDNSMSRHQPL